MARNKIDPPKGGNNLQSPDPNYPKGTKVNQKYKKPSETSTKTKIVNTLVGPLLGELTKSKPKSGIDQTPMGKKTIKGGAPKLKVDDSKEKPKQQKLGKMTRTVKAKPKTESTNTKATPANPKIEKMDIKGPQKIETSKPRTSPEKLPDAPKPKHKLSPKEVVTNMKLGINNMRQRNEEMRNS